MDSRSIELAVKAAREAGALFREAFHERPRPGDVRDKAAVDTEAEVLIRRMLDAAFPEDGIQAEELPSENRAPARAGGRVRDIDPQDGTASFHDGWRGPAVSIGLVEDGKPVLGVVLAYAAPDDRGDLFVWAEGMDSILRNDRPAPRPAWPDGSSASATVLVPPWAEKRPRAWSEMVEPARFRTTPSLAWQLALVAVGDAAALISPGDPRDLDCAGGHALLRGAGGDLVDGSGAPVRYETGRTVTYRHVIGGAPRVVTALVRRDWGSVIGRPPEIDPGEHDPILPERGAAERDSDLLSRAQGALLGQLAGDSLGSLVEFRSAQDIRGEYLDGPRRLVDGGTWSTLAGQPTDDSELALMLARSLVRAGRFDGASVLRAYAHWYESGPFDMGATTRRALSAASRALREGVPDPVLEVSRAGSPDSQANGALMRVSPLGVFGHAADPAALAGWAREDAGLTHPHPVCRDASAVHAVTIARAVASGQDPRELHRFAVEWARASGIEPSVVKALEDAAAGPPEDYEEQQGWVLKALRNAYWQLLEAPSLEEGVVDTVRRGGDTDTNAAIAGALLGAVHGLEAVPLQWVDRVVTCRPIPGMPHVVRGRPRAFWPVDALVLAERLVLTGRTVRGAR